MKYFSLFSGIGGFESGIQNSFLQSRQDRKEDKLSSKEGEHSEQSQGTIRQPTPICVGFSEIDKYATQIYKKHFNHKEYGDVSKINWRDVEDFDLLCGGFPCQAFSIAGKRGGFNDTRGTLFFEIAKAAQHKQPRLLLLENVKGLLSHNQGETFYTILKTLDGIGYDLQWQVLNSKNFGVPQNRERVFIVGHLRGTSRPEVFPIGEDDRICSEWGEKRNETKQQGKQNIKNRRRYTRCDAGQGMRVYGIEGENTTIASQAGGLGAKTGLYKVKAVLTPNRKEKRQNGRRMKENGEPSFTLTGQDIHGVSYENKIRRLTPTECCRLQGFPDDWCDGVSDTQRYKMLGNAVTVNVIQAIMERLLKEN